MNINENSLNDNKVYVSMLLPGHRQESWLKDPEASVPFQREKVVPKLSPVKVKKELKDFADLIKLFGPNSLDVKDSGAAAHWKTRTPLQFLEDLDTMTGWSRCPATKCFKVDMPGEGPSLKLSDEEPASWLKKHFRMRRRSWLM